MTDSAPKAVTMYEASDGKQFRTEQLCREYEDECQDLAAANALLEKGESLLSALERAHVRARPWWRASALQDGDAHLLSRITKDTALAIPHWQCREQPGYKPCELRRGGDVWVYGYTGSWSGSYGNWMNLQDLLRYARDTERRFQLRGRDASLVTDGRWQNAEGTQAFNERNEKDAPSPSSPNKENTQ